MPNVFERQIADRLQRDFPLTPRPFAALAVELGRSENKVLDAVRALRKQNIIRRLSAIFDTRRLGYESCLAAAKVEPGAVKEVAAFISRHPGVSHNYLRACEYNLWFTLAVPPDSRLGLKKTAAVFAGRPGVTSVRLFPALEIYKIGVRFDLSEAEATEGREVVADQAVIPSKETLPLEKRPLVWELQKDVQSIPEPFSEGAERLGVSPAEYLTAAEELRASGVMRRFAAVLNHREAGFEANAMGVWAVPEKRLEEFARRATTFKAVSHCYRRPTYPDWPYGFYTMVHGHNEEECRALLGALASETGLSDYKVVFSRREFKKVRVKYFSPALHRWEDRHAPAAEN